MGTDVMGRVVVEVQVESLEDLFRHERGELASSEVRRLVISDALVDTGATTIAMPKKLIDQLGLRLRRMKRMRTANGDRDCGIYDPVKITIQGRDCAVDVAELPNDCPTLIGQIPLESMDWVIDMKGQKLIGNPAHGGEWVGELY